MNELLQDAITAARAGDNKEAQLLLTRNLEQNPGDVDSWYLLSMLVDEPEKQALYLGKTLALDPEYGPAKERVEQMEVPEVAPAMDAADALAASSVSISDGPYDFDEQEKGTTLPNWLADDADAIQLDKVGEEMTADEMDGEVDQIADGDENVPEWLQSDVEGTWEVDEPATDATVAAIDKEVDVVADPTPVAQETATPSPASKPKRPRTKKEQKSRLNWAMIGLIFAMLLVFAMLIYYVLVLS